MPRRSARTLSQRERQRSRRRVRPAPPPRYVWLSVHTLTGRESGGADETGVTPESLELARRAGADRPNAGRGRAVSRRRGVLLALGDGPLLPDPAQRCAG